MSSNVAALKLYINQPYLAKYRLAVFNQLCDSYSVCVGAGLADSYGDFGTLSDQRFQFDAFIEADFFGGRLKWQKGFVSSFLRFRPDSLIITGNPRYISSWVVLVISLFLPTKVFVHGQGVYKKKVLRHSDRAVYWLYSIFCEKYLCYTSSCRESLSGTRIYGKSVVVENSLTFETTVTPAERSGLRNAGILFVGRIRKGSNIDLLVDALDGIAERHPNVLLHIVGAVPSPLASKLRGNKYVKLWGEVYDPAEIADISMQCCLGCYPGDAGLSVVHYMSLSLPVVMHSDLRSHMGPEPSYITSGVVGETFIRDDSKSLLSALLRIMDLPNEGWRGMCMASYDRYRELTNPSMASRISKAVQSS